MYEDVSWQEFQKGFFSILIIIHFHIQRIKGPFRVLLSLVRFHIQRIKGLLCRLLPLVHSAQFTRVARFSLVQYTKNRKIIHRATKKLPDVHHMYQICTYKIYQMVVKNTKSFLSKALKNIQEAVFLVWKYAIWQPCNWRERKCQQHCSQMKRKQINGAKIFPCLWIQRNAVVTMEI
jgi:hypothetical protein